MFRGDFASKPMTLPEIDHVFTSLLMRRHFSPVTSPGKTSFSHFADTFFLIYHISAVIFSLEEASCYSSLNRFRSIPLKDSRFLEA